MTRRIFAFLVFALSLCFAAPGYAQHTVSSTFFGSQWNHVAANGSQPTPWCPQDGNSVTATLTSFRVWDDNMKWDQIETASGTYSWGLLDEAVNNLIATPGCLMSMIYTVGATPEWATACNGSADPGTCLPGPTGSGFGGGTQCSSPDDWSCLPPSDIAADGTGTYAQFQNFIGNVMLRYPNLISYYELGNEFDSPNFSCSTSSVAACGSSSAQIARAIRMGWDARKLAGCYSPNSKILSPSFHVGTALTWFDTYNTTSISAPAGNITIASHTCSWSAQSVTGKMVWDYPNEHMRGTTGTNSDPASVIAAYNNLHTEMANLGLSPACYFNDEWGLNGGQSPNIATTASHLAASLVLQTSFSNPPICSENWYQWDNGDYVASQTIVGTANDVVAGWLVGATVNNYSLSGTVYTVTGTKGGAAFEILFDDFGTCSGTTISTCSTTNESAGTFSTYTDLTGTSHSISGGVAPVGFAPVMLSGVGTGPMIPQLIARSHP